MRVKTTATIDGWEVAPTSCGICNSVDHQLLWKKDSFSYVQCKQCGTVRVDPQLAPHAVADIYALGYKNKKQASFSTASNPALFGSLIQSFERYRRSQHLLDVGCFTGKFLVTARESGWHVHGVELSEPAVDFCRTSLGLDVRRGTLQSAESFPPASMDIVTMFDVIEHLPKPLLDMERARSVLRPGGLLYVETPNYGSIARRLLGKEWRVFFPWHFYYYTADTISGLLERSGFEIVSVRAVGLGPLSRFNAYRSLMDSGNMTPASLADSVKRNDFARRYIHLVRRTWLTMKRFENLPFRLFSRVGLHLGGKLKVWAER